MPELEVISGEVVDTRILGGDFFGRATVKPSKGPGVPCVGKLLGVQPGDSVQARGCWTTHPRWGRQFKLQAIETVVPRDSTGVVAWLASRLPNLGPTRAQALVEELGAEGVWHVIEHEPDRLLSVRGITAERRDEIVKAYWENRGERDRIVRFKSWGLTDSQVASVIATWGARAEDRIREDPYELAEHVMGFGFKRADAVAQRMGLPSDSPSRVRAGLLHVMDEAEEQGHCWLYAGRLVGVAAKLLGLEEKLVAGGVRALVETGRLRRIGESERVATPELADAEQHVAQRARAFTGPSSARKETAA